MEGQISHRKKQRSRRVHSVFYTLQSVIIGKRLSENAPAGKPKLPREIRVPISKNYACLSTLRTEIFFLKCFFNHKFTAECALSV